MSAVTQRQAPDTGPARFRDILGRFASGVTVITGRHGDQPVGMTCQSFMSMSLDPPLVAFAPAVASTTYPRIRAGGRFGVSVLADHQADVASMFSQPASDRFAAASWRAGVTGVPLIRDAVAHVECDLIQEHLIGDHLLAVGRVLALEGHPTARPLIFFRRAFGTIHPAREGADRLKEPR